MTIAQMNNDQAADAMIRLSAAFSFLCEDEEVTGLLDELKDYGNMPVIIAVPKLLPKATKLLFRRHRDALYEIVSCLSLVPKSEVGSMNFKKTLQIIQENWDELRDFFPTSSSLSRKTEEASA